MAKDKQISDDVLYAGKVPPHSKELEMNVLGGMMIDNGLCDIVFPILKPKMFYVNANKVIYESIIELRSKGLPIDLITLTEVLKTRGELDATGGPYYLSELSTAFASQSSIVFSAHKILDYWIKRDMILLGLSISEMAYDAAIEAKDLLDKGERGIIETAGTLYRKSYITSRELISETMTHAEKIMATGKGITGVPSGYEDLDELTGGFQNAELIIIAGRPSHGKSALALNIARNAAVDHGKVVGIFSIEMSNREMGMRLVSLESEVWISKFKDGSLNDKDFKKINDVAPRLIKAPMLMDDTAPLTLLELKSKARRMKAEHGIDMIIVDYLQIMDLDEHIAKRGLDRHLEIAYITRGLKTLSKELDIPVVALSQLSRKVEDRGSKDRRPQLSDLRESGAIEQDADVVIFINRPEIYISKESPEYDKIKGIAEVIVGKQRNGPIGDIKLTFRSPIARFSRYSYQSAPEYYKPKSEEMEPEMFSNKDTTPF